MPKLKTRRAVKKRFRITRKGKVMAHHSKMRHLLECKPAKKKRALRKGGALPKVEATRVKQMLVGG